MNPALEQVNPGAKLAKHTIRLLQDNVIGSVVTTDEVLFGMAYAALAPFFREQIPTKDIPSSHELRTELREVQKNLTRLYGEDKVTAQLIMNIHTGTSMHADYAAKGWDEWKKFLSTVEKDALDEYTKGMNTIEYNIDSVSALLGLTEVEIDVLEFQVLRSACPDFQIFYDRLFARVAMWKETTKRILTILFNGDELSSDSVLVKSGLVKINYNHGIFPPMSRDIASLFFAVPQGEQSMFPQIVKPMKPKMSGSGSIGTIATTDLSIIKRLMAAVDVKNQEDEDTITGVNVLFYGDSAVDKKGTIYSSFKDEANIFVLRTKRVNRSDLGPRAFLAQRFLQEVYNQTDTKSPILIVEQADDVLSSVARSFASMFGFAEANENTGDDIEADEILLSENGVPTFWITNNPRYIKEDTVGRFLFHAEVKPASRATRLEQVKNVLSTLDLDPDVEEHLSKYHLLTERQVKSGVAITALITDDRVESQDVLKHVVLQSQRVLGREAMEELRDSVTKYSLDYVNVRGALTPDEIIKALKKRPAGTMCLYGIPGAGKTQLVEYMAKELDMPLLKKRASDILGKYVGENEKNIAAMFQEAKAEGAILFLDEADSFLRDRQMARAEWNVTQVNELLQQIESFNGIFICATNLFRDIDAAALRRFTFKLEFLALKDDQRWEMLCNESQMLEGEGLPQEELDRIRNKLEKIKYLAPGDFATVKRQANILDKKLTPDEWLQQLEDEATDKLAGIERNKIGFHP